MWALGVLFLCLLNGSRAELFYGLPEDYQNLNLNLNEAQEPVFEGFTDQEYEQALKEQQLPSEEQQTEEVSDDVIFFGNSKKVEILTKSGK